MTLFDFKDAVAEACCRVGEVSKQRGRPSEEAVAYSAKRQKMARAVRPSIEVRLDGIDHLPEYGEKRLQCKNFSCTNLAQIKCVKCNVTLCLNKTRNCFMEFHTK